MTRKPVEGRPEFTLALCEQILRDNPPETEIFYGRLMAAIQGKGVWIRPNHPGNRKPRKPKVMAARA